MNTDLFAAQLKRLSKLLAGFTALLGASIAIARLYLFGYAVEPQFPHLVAGVNLLLCGASVYLQHDEAGKHAGTLAHSLAASSLGIALLTVAYYLLMGRPVESIRAIIMPPNTAIAVLLLSLAIVLLRSGAKGVLVAQILALTSLAISVPAIVGHAFGTPLFAQVGRNMPMTTGAAVLLSLLALSVVFSRPAAGIMQVLVSPSMGGVMARRLFSPTILIPMLIAWLTYQWQQDRVFSNAFGLAIMAIGTIVLLSVLLWSQAIALDRHDHARLQNSAELARIDENLHLLVQTVRDHAIYRLDLEGRITSWNSGAQHILGYRAEEIVGAGFDKLFSRVDLESGLPGRLLQSARIHGHTVQEHWSVRQDGSMLYAYTTITALYEAYRPVGFVSLMQNISEGKRDAEERAMLRSMLATMMDAVIVIDEKGIIESLNPSAEKAFGYTADEMIGGDIGMLMPSPHREQHNAYLARYLRTGERRVIGVNRELVAQRKDGSQFPIELTVSEMIIANQRKFTGVLRDITERQRAEEALRQYDQRFRAVYDNAAVGIAIVSPNKRFLYVNRKMTEITGYTVDELLSRSFEDISYPDDVDVGMDQYRKLLAGAVDSILIEKRYRRKDGSAIWIDASVSCVRSTNGEPAYTIEVIEDISARKAAEEALRKSKQDLDVTLDGTNVHLWHLDCEARTVNYLDKLPQSLGFMQDDVRPDLDFWLALFHPEDRAHILENIRHISKDPCDAGETEARVRTRDGQWKWMLLRARIVERCARGLPLRVAGTCLDITERKQAEQKMLHVAQHDALTGLPNRALAYEFGERTLAAARRDGLQSAVLFIDLDRFKPINDTYGHDAGDEVLREVARRLLGCIRREDVVGRLGGDEFLIVLADVDGPRGAGRVAAQCIAALGQPCAYRDLKLQVSSSIGISLFPADGNDIFALATNADTAMYHAKECGRDNFQFFTEELNARAACALNMENRLRGGLRQNEFQLYYQPIVEVDSGAVIGAEALLRWPETGIMPEQFIPIAEYTGLIHQLGEWALNEACRQQRAWQANGLNALKISVNVSPAQFRQAGFRSIVAKAVVESGIDPSFLQLEITENVLVKNSETVVETLQALKQLGLHVVLDDFGKGYSSLAYLKHLPVDAIKIDRDFIHDLDVDRGNMAITAAIINLGIELGLQVIAEGIESETILQSLHARHCQAIQGFYICHPVAGKDFEDWYRRRSYAMA